MGYSRFWLKAADEESKSIPHEFPRSHWLKATGQCVLECYLSATMLSKVMIPKVSNSDKFSSLTFITSIEIILMTTHSTGRRPFTLINYYRYTCIFMKRYLSLLFTTAFFHTSQSWKALYITKITS